MRVNTIQNNRSNPSHRALRIRNNNSRYLLTLPDKVLNKLDEIGQYLSNTKYFHLDITNDEFFICPTNGSRIYQPYTVTNAGKCIIIKGKLGLNTYIRKLKYKTEKEVNVICQKISAAQTQIERTTEIIKCLDDYEEGLQKSEALLINSTDNRDVKIKKLVSKYGTHDQLG